MSDPFEDNVRRGLQQEADDLAVPAPNLRSVARDGDSPRGAVWFGIAAAIVVLAVGGTLLFANSQPSVVLEQPGGVVPSGETASGEGASGSAVAGPATVDALTGRVFESVDGLPGAPDPDGAMTLQFRPPTSSDQPDPGLVVRTDPGCNTAGGGYELTGDGTLILGEYVSTMMECFGVPAGMDDWTASLLQARPRLELTGNRLSVISDDATIHLQDVGLQECEAVIQGVVTEVIDAVAAVDVEAFLQGELVLADENGVEGGAQLARLERTGCAHDAVRARIDNQLNARAQDWVDDPEQDNWTRYFIVQYFASILSPNTSGRLRPSMPPGPLTQANTASPAPTWTATPSMRPSAESPPPLAVTPPPQGTSHGATMTAAPAPVSTPVPSGGDVWCAEQGFVGAIVTTDQTLLAVCADGTNQPITEDAGWRSVAVSPDRVVGERVVPGPTLGELVAFDVVDGTAMSLGEGAAPALTSEDRLAWLTPDGMTVQVAATQDGSEVAFDAGTALDDLSWDRSGRWLFATTVATDADPARVLAWDTTIPDVAPVEVANDGVLAAAGETDTPDNVMVLTQVDGQLTLQASFVGQPGAPGLFGLGAPQAPVETFAADGTALVVPVSMLAFDPDQPEPWFVGNSIGWLLGNGDALWYHDGVSTILMRNGVRDLAVAPSVWGSPNGGAAP